MSRVPALLLAAGGLALLVVVVFLPLLRDPAHTTAISVSHDNYADFWNLWWFHEAAAHRWNPFFTRLLYYPNGSSLYFAEFGPFYGLLALPLVSLLGSPDGPVLAHNLFVMGTFLATGTLAFAFARQATGSFAGGLVAGGAAALAPFRIHHLEHLNLLSGYWILAAALVAGGWCLRPRWLVAGGESEAGPPPPRRRLFVLAACGLGTALTSATILSITVLFLTLWLGLSIVIQPGRWYPGRFPRLAAAAGAYALGALPVVGGWIVAVLRGRAPVMNLAMVEHWGPDLAGFVLPQGSRLLGGFVEAAGRGLHGPGGAETYLGWALLALAGVGLVRGGRHALPLGFTALAAWAVCLGPILWLGGRQLDVPVTPYDALTSLVPFFSASRTPERILLAALAALGPLAAAGVFRLWGGRRSRWALAAAVAVLAVELWPPPIAVERVRVDPVFRALASDPAPGAVMELSLDPIVLNDFAFHQIIHHRPIVGGNLARCSPGAMAFQDDLDLYRRLSYPSTTGGAMDDLRRAGVAFLAIYRGPMGERSWDFLVRSYSEHAEPFDRDERRAVFRLAR